MILTENAWSMRARFSSVFAAASSNGSFQSARRSMRSVLAMLHVAVKFGSAKVASSCAVDGELRHLRRDQRALHRVDQLEAPPRRQHPVLAAQREFFERRWCPLITIVCVCCAGVSQFQTPRIFSASASRLDAEPQACSAPLSEAE